MTMHLSEILLLFAVAATLGNAVEIPCNAVKKSAGFICLCNSTYCDTVESPGIIKPRQFHVYSTSNEKPGFNHYTGFFKMQAFSPAGVKITVNDKIKRQKIRGFGGSFTDSFGSVLNKLSTASQTNLLKSYFAEDGVEYSLCRLVFGSSDFSPRHYTYVPNYDPSLKSFNLTEDDYMYKISHVLRAQQLTSRKIKLLGTTWTPPPWMKRNNGMEPNYLIPKFRQAWADYHVKFLDAYKKEGIELWGLTTGNEPLTFIVIHGNIANLVMYPEEQREWIANNLGPTFEKTGYGNLSLILLDDQRPFAFWWMDTVLRTGVANKYVSGIGLHWYFDTTTSPLMLDQMNEKYPDQEILYTESSINPAMHTMTRRFDPRPPELGSWRRANIYVTNIIENLSHWVTGFIDWNLGLNTDGGPNVYHMACDSSILINEEADEFYKQPVFYVMGHFSKFLQPGASIIDLKPVGLRDERENNNEQEREPPRPPPTDDGQSMVFPTSYVYDDVKYIGAVNPDGSHTVIIFNPTLSAAEVAIHDPDKGYAFLVLEPESLTSVVY